MLDKFAPVFWVRLIQLRVRWNRIILWYISHPRYATPMTESEHQQQ